MTVPDDRAPSQVIASHPDYAAAQRAVDGLADQEFPVDRLAIVGANLQSFEQVTGRRGYGRVAVEGATTGALVGAFVGSLLGLFTLVQPLVSALLLAVWGLLLGGAIGALVGLASHALSGGKRDFSSVATVRAERYDVLATTDVADQARQLLVGTGAAGGSAGR